MQRAIISLAMIFTTAACSKSGLETSARGETPRVQFSEAALVEQAQAGKPAFHVTSKDPATARFAAVILKAFQEDPNLVASRLRAGGLRQSAKAQGRFWRPEVSLDAQTYDKGVTLRVDQPLYDFGKRAAKIAQTLADESREHVTLAQSQELLLRTALTAVLDYDFATQKANIHTGQIADLRRASDSARKLVDLSLLSDADLRLAEVELHKAEIQRLQSQQDAQEAQLVWASVTNGAKLPGALDLGSLRRALKISTAAQAQETALKRSVDLRRFDVENEQLEAKLLGLKSRHRPTISATALVIASGATVDEKVGLTLSYPIFRRETKDQISMLEIDTKAISQELSAVKRDIKSEMERLAKVASSANSLAQRQKSSLALLRQRVKDLDFQLENGLAAYTDVIKAKSDAFEAELDILKNNFAARYAHANIVVLSGAMIP